MSTSRASAASSLLIGAAFVAVAFGAAGGTELARTTTVELLLLLAAACFLAFVTLLWRERRLHGVLAVVCFCLLVGVTVLSVLWSIAPELSYVEAGRAFAYLVVFAAAVAAPRVFPRAAPTLLKAILIAALAVVAYALASRVWPGTLAEDEISARIGAPYGYWNAVGTNAAMLVPAALWLGSRREARIAVSALAYPVLGLAIVAILLTQSRGALAAAVCGVALWLALVPLRLRSLPLLLLPAAGAAPIAAWALSKDAFSKALQPLAVKESVAGEFGLLLLLMSVGLLAAGLAVSFALSRRAPPLEIRRRVGIAAAAGACLLPLALFTSVAFSDRGLGGTLHDRVHDLTSETASTPTGASRLTASSSSRARYWRQAGRVFAHHPVLGTGAGTFGIARLRYRKDRLVSRHAHGYIPQAMADTGLLGLAVTLALFVAWLVAAGRTTALHPRLRRGPPVARRDWHAERIAIVALALVAVVFGLQSAIDWTWFVPGPAVMALSAAGFVAGRGPLPAAGAANAETSTVAFPRPDPPRAMAAGGLLVATLLLAWAIWQPERSDSASDRALDLMAQGDLSAALAKADDAHHTNPLSPRPLYVKAAVQTALRRPNAAHVTLETAVLDFPGDPQAWLRLATFELQTQDRPSKALDTLRGVFYLDPRSKAAQDLYVAASERARQAAPSHRGAN